MQPHLFSLGGAALAIAFLLLRNRRPRRLRLAWLWVAPALVCICVAGLLAQNELPPWPALGVFASALAVGAALGRWRGAETVIMSDATGALYAQASRFGLLIVSAGLAVRQGLRAVVDVGLLPFNPALAADALLLLAVGLVVAQRAEVARRVLAGRPRSTLRFASADSSAKRADRP